MSTFLDNAAEESDEEKRPVEEDSDDEDNIPNEFEKDDFLVDEEEEEEAPAGRAASSSSASTGENRRKRKRDRLRKVKERVELNEELQELLRDNEPKSKQIDTSTVSDNEDILDEEEEEQDASLSRKKPKKGSFYDDGFIVGRIPTYDEFDEIEDVFGTGRLDEEDFQDDLQDRDNILIPEEDEEDEDSRQLDQSKKDSFEKLKLIYGPDAVAQKFLTEKDKIIRETDIPERIQLHQGIREINYDLELEAKWIFENSDLKRRAQDEASRLLYSRDDTFEDLTKQYVQHIIKVLEYILKERFDIPFIATYRREYFEPLLRNDEDLWKIFEYDEKWCYLMEKKEQLKRMAPNTSNVMQDFIEQASTLDEVNDLIAYYQMHDQSSSSSNSAQLKRRKPIKKDLYHACKKSAPIVQFSKWFGIGAQEFAENCALGYMKHTKKEENNQEPLEIAKQYQSKEFNNPKKVLHALCYLIAYEIAHEPIVKQKLRSKYGQYLTVSTKLTSKGEQVQFEGYKEIKNFNRASLINFESQQFLYLYKAERDGYIQATYSLDDTILEETLLFQELYSCIQGDKWNKLKTMILANIKKMIHNPLVQELKTTQWKQACQYVSDKCEKELEKCIMSGPIGLRKREDEQGNLHVTEQKQNPRILSCCCPLNSNEQTTFIMLDQNGVVVDALSWNMDVLHHLTNEGEVKSSTSAELHSSLLELDKLIQNNSPDAIAVATSGQVSIRLKKYLEKKMMDSKMITVEYVADDFAKIFETCQQGKQEFPDYSNIMKRAVSVGRRCYDPLTEIATLFNNENDILCYKFHPQQHMVPQDVLLNSLEKAFVRTTCKVGVDINKVLGYKHLQSTLRFVCGLGPRKANDLIEKIGASSAGFLESRKALVVTQHNSTALLPPKIFYNCASFLKIQDYRKEYPYDPMDILDRTRVHPESYEYALKMCVDALDIDNYDQANTSKYVKRVMRDAKSLLKDLELDVYAKLLEEIKNVKKHITLNEIAKELQYPFEDPRYAFESISVNRLFELITGETDETLRVNKVITVIISKIVNTGGGWIELECLMDNGVLGIIRNKKLPEGFMHRLPRDSSDVTEKVFEVGQAIEAKIDDIDKINFEVDLDARTEELKYYREEEQQQSLSSGSGHSNSAMMRKRKSKRMDKKVNHPFFQNLSYVQAVDYLQNKQVGDIVIRPSSKGMDHLALTFKFYGDTCVNLDIEEKEEKNSKVYYVSGQKYEDLDEICYHYVEAVMRLAKSVIEHPKYVDKSGEKVEAMLKEEKQQNPKRIPYCVVLNRTLAGKFLICYLPGHSKMKQELVTVTPRGFVMFKKLVGDSVEKLINCFKKYVMKKSQQTQQTQQQQQQQDLNSSSTLAGEAW